MSYLFISFKHAALSDSLSCSRLYKFFFDHDFLLSSFINLEIINELYHTQDIPKSFHNLQMHYSQDYEASAKPMQDKPDLPYLTLIGLRWEFLAC